MTYRYDGASRQIAKTDTTPGAAELGTTTYDYAGPGSSALLHVSKSDGANTYAALTVTGLTWAASKVTTTGTGTVQTEVGDGRGNAGTALDSSGNVACQRRFDPWGTPRGAAPTQAGSLCEPVVGGNGASQTGAIADLGYTGARADTTTGAYQFGARTYTPATAAFTSPDSAPTTSAGGPLAIGVDPLTRNSYNYVNGDPINQIDPSGHYSCSVREDDDVCPGHSITGHDETIRQGASRSEAATDRFFAGQPARITAAILKQNRACASKLRAEECSSDYAGQLGGYHSGVNDFLSAADQFAYSLQYDANQKQLAADVSRAQARRAANHPWWQTVVSVGVGILVGGAVGALCTFATGAVGSPACVYIAGAIGGAASGLVDGLFTCNGSVACTASSIGFGAAGGLIGGALGKFAARGLRALASRALSRLTTSAAEEGAAVGGGGIPFGPGSEKAWRVLERVTSKGSPLPGYKGGSVFQNSEGLLPELDGAGKSITYREWDLNPYTKGVNRGPERIVTGSDGSAYYTGDHYGSFLQFWGAGE